MALTIRTIGAISPQQQASRRDECWRERAESLHRRLVVHNVRQHYHVEWRTGGHLCRRRLLPIPRTRCQHAVGKAIVGRALRGECEGARLDIGRQDA